MFRKFLSYYKKHYKLLILDLFCAFSISAIDLLFPEITGQVLDQLLPNGEFQLVYILLAFLVVAYLIRLVFSYIVSYYGHTMGTRIEKEMRKDLFEKYEVLDDSFYDKNKTGQLLSHLTNHLRDISEMSHHAPEDIFISVVMFGGSFTILMFKNVALTLVMLVMVLIVILFSLWRRNKMLGGFRKVRHYHGELNSQVESSISGIRLTKAFTNEEYETEKFETLNVSYQDSWKDAYKQMGIFHTGNEFLMLMTSVVVLAFGSYLVSNGQLSTGDLFVYFMFINNLIKPINRLMNSMEQIQQGWSGFEKFYEIMQIVPTIRSKEDPVYLRNPKGQIEFQHVSFTYPSSNEDILTDFNLVIPQGHKIALIGETGVGKSTISKLIPRFYDVDQGSILVDGVNVKDYDLYSLRNAIGHVQQDVFIFYGTIKENIRYGKIDATDEEIMLAAKRANIHDFIMHQETQYDTMVGERGVRLSGGQKQRIAIARLFLRNPAIIILDEATSALDNITEKLIQESFEELAKGKTTLIIAHRLSTIKDADEILVLKKEGVVERGTHEELMKKDSYYASLYKAANE